jgi:hypothetical protein
MIYRNLSKQKEHVISYPEYSFNYIKSLSKKGYFIIDDSAINKEYSCVIQGTSEVFDSLTSRPCLGFSIITLVWTDGISTIPVAYTYWYNKNVIGDEYKSKIELSKELITLIPSSIEFHGVVLDGLYASQEMMAFLIEKNIKFVMRAATNRVISCKGIKKTLKEHPALKLRKNEHSRTAEAQWNGLKLHFTSEKRKNKNGDTSIVFLVANFETDSKNCVAIYRLRWDIEIFYRTAKQSLGLKDCQSTDLAMHKVRVYNVFYIYAFLQHQKKLQKSLNVESVIRYFRSGKEEDLMTALISFNEIFFGPD